MALPARARAKQVFLLLSAFEQKYWLHQIVGHLLDELDRASIDAVLKIPHRDYDCRTLTHHMRGFLQRKDDYIGGYVVVTEVDHIRDPLTAFCRAFGSPVVFLDLDPFPCLDAFPPSTGFVGYQPTHLGETAATWLAPRLPAPDPIVHVLASREHRGRQDRFAEVLRRELPRARITVDETCAFSRTRAVEALTARLCGDGPTPDAVFCTNDEMALGATDALRWAPPTACTVIGIDGVADALAEIDRGHSPLQATVVQDSRRIAINAVDVLHCLHAGDRSPVYRVLEAEVHTRRPRSRTVAPLVHNELHTTAPSATIGTVHNLWITNDPPQAGSV